MMAIAIDMAVKLDLKNSFDFSIALQRNPKIVDFPLTENFISNYQSQGIFGDSICLESDAPRRIVK